MIPTDRTLYLEVAKKKRHDRRWVFMCLANVRRIMNKEKAAAPTATDPLELTWD